MFCEILDVEKKKRVVEMKQNKHKKKISIRKRMKKVAA